MYVRVTCFGLIENSHLFQDLIALIVQAVGGAKASMASGPADTELGGHIALGESRLPLPLCHSGMRWVLNVYPAGGIAFQFGAIVIYMTITCEFLIRYYLDRPFPRRRDTFIGKLLGLDSKTKQMIFGALASSFCMFMRYFLFPPPAPTPLSG